MHIKKPSSLLTAALFSTALASATFSTARAQSVTIYDLESLTGPAQGVGVPQANAMKLAADQINAKGGIKVGNQSYKIDLVVEDDRSAPTAGVTAVQKMLSSGKPVFMVGSLSSAVTGAYAPIVKTRADVISIVVGAALEGITDNQSIWRPRITLSQYTTGTLDYLKKQAMSSKKIALMTDNKHAGFVQQTGALKDGLKSIGFEVVGEEEWSFGATQFGPQVSAVMRAKPDLLHIRGYGSDVARSIRQAREGGYTGPILAVSGMTEKDVTDAQATASMNGVSEVFAPQVTDLVLGKRNDAQAKSFEDAYQKQFGQPSGTTSLSAFGGMYILAQAISKAGTVTDIGAIRKALDGLKVADVPELIEPIKPADGGAIFKDHQANFVLVVRRWQGDKFMPAGFVD